MLGVYHTGHPARRDPLHLLVGMDFWGILTGAKVLYYAEAYRSFRGDFVGDAGFTL